MQHITKLIHCKAILLRVILTGLTGCEVLTKLGTNCNGISDIKINTDEIASVRKSFRRHIFNRKCRTSAHLVILTFCLMFTLLDTTKYYYSPLLLCNAFISDVVKWVRALNIKHYHVLFRLRPIRVKQKLIFNKYNKIITFWPRRVWVQNLYVELRTG